MNFSFSSVSGKLIALLAFSFGSFGLVHGQTTTPTATRGIIDMDFTRLGNVNPVFIPILVEAMTNAESVWEERIQNYSTNLPKGILNQYPRLTIFTEVMMLDGPLNILAQAGPDATLSTTSGNILNPKTVEIPVVSTMTYDSDDLLFLINEGFLEEVAIHEMGHALGLGSLWQANGFVDALDGVGVVQYLHPGYAIRNYRIEANFPFSPFIPLEQTGGGGTAGSHWDGNNPFFNQAFTAARTQEVMTGFLNVIDPETGESFVVPKFISETTWGALADLGYEVSGINDNAVDPPTANVIRNWPKVTGSGLNPFQPNVVDPDADGLRFNLNKVRTPIKFASKNTVANPGGATAKGIDPYRLRKQGWVK